MRTSMHPVPKNAGFSLIEVMIAVIVLAVGMLALVGLQSRLVREGANAKARSRIASLVSSRIDELRAGGYYSIPDNNDADDVDSAVTLACPSSTAICDAQQDAAVANLTLSQPRAVRAVGANSSEYKTVTVTASWTDSAGESRSLSMRTAISPLSLDTSGTMLNQPLAGDSAKSPVVRTSNPATAGVVPIALGDGSSSAASNPTPELVGKNQNTQVVGTRFNVLTYVPSGGDAVIQRRVETAVIKCSCEFGALPATVTAVFREPQWPAIWTGERYNLFTKSDGSAPSVPQARPVSTVNQSPLCLECCRDHHDTAASGVAKFDPERPAESAGKFNLVNNALGQTPVTSGQYVNACRIIRVDGLWRTASDMYLRQMGLLETQTASNSIQPATSGLPTAAATSAYEGFVKAYLSEYTGDSGTPPSGVDPEVEFNKITALNAPTLLTILAPSPSDYRYLHSRGLYVDYLESAARDKIKNAIANCPMTKAKADCILPFLPFTSANLTEIARWTARKEGTQEEDTSVLVVNSGNLLQTNPEQPSGGRTFGQGVGTAASEVATGRSNAGIAVSDALANVRGVDPSDWATQARDRQAIKVEGTTGGTSGAQFNVRVVGGGTNPFVFYSIGTADTAECAKPRNKDHLCVTRSALPTTVVVRVGRYWTVGSETGSLTCTVGNQTVTQSNYVYPALINYQVSSTTPANSSVAVTGTDGQTDEASLVTFANLAAGTTAVINLVPGGTNTKATMKSCELKTTGQTTTIRSVIWNESWAN